MGGGGDADDRDIGGGHVVRAVGGGGGGMRGSTCRCRRMGRARLTVEVVVVVVAALSFVVPEKSHLLISVVKLLPLGHRDQGVRNTAKHSQVTEIRFSAVPNFVGALTLQGGVW